MGNDASTEAGDTKQEEGVEMQAPEQGEPLDTRFEPYDVVFKKHFGLEITPYSQYLQTGAIVVDYYSNRAEKKVEKGSKIVSINGVDVEILMFTTIKYEYMKNATFPCTITFQLPPRESEGQDRQLESHAFDVDRKAFAQFLQKMRKPALQKFWDKFDQDNSNDLDEREMRKLLHAAICLYFRNKTENHSLQLPKRSATNLIVRDICEVIWTRVRTKTLIRQDLDKIGDWLLEYYERKAKENHDANVKERNWTLEGLWEVTNEIDGPLKDDHQEVADFFPKEFRKEFNPDEELTEKYVIGFTVWFMTLTESDKERLWNKKLASNSKDEGLSDIELKKLLLWCIEKHFKTCGKHELFAKVNVWPLYTKILELFHTDLQNRSDDTYYYVHFRQLGELLKHSAQCKMFSYNLYQLGDFIVQDLHTDKLKKIWRFLDPEKNGFIPIEKVEPMVVLLSIFYGRSKKLGRPVSLLRQGKISKIRVNEVTQVIKKHVQADERLLKTEFLDIPDWLKNTYEAQQNETANQLNRVDSRREEKKLKNKSADKQKIVTINMTTHKETQEGDGGEEEGEQEEEELEAHDGPFWKYVDLGSGVDLTRFRRFVRSKRKKMWKYFSQKWTQGDKIKTAQIAPMLHNFVVVFCHNTSGVETPSDGVIQTFCDAWRDTINNLEDGIHEDPNDDSPYLTQYGFNVICDLLIE